MHQRVYTYACFVILGAGVAGYGQQPRPPGAAEDPLGPPTQRGIRITPGMARGMAQLVTRQALMPHYELDAAKADEAAELIARRLMSTAHAVDANGAALAEFFITKMCDAQADHPHGVSGDEIFTPEMQKGMAEKVLPTLPAIRELIGGVGRDVAPMLPLKQQLKMAGELAMVGTALDLFDKNMQRWARGEGQPGENPFSDEPAGPKAMKKDTSGQSPLLKAAREAAQQELDKQGWISRIWANYLKEFKSFYELDASQCGTADSLLREYLERASVLQKNAAWRDQIYHSRLWLRMAPALRMAQVFTSILNSRYEESMAPINTLGDEFRLALEAIPTEAQKAAAEARITAALKERGYEKPEVK